MRVNIGKMNSNNNIGMNCILDKIISHINTPLLAVIFFKSFTIKEKRIFMIVYNKYFL